MFMVIYYTNVISEIFLKFYPAHHLISLKIVLFTKMLIHCPTNWPMLLKLSL